MLKLVQIGKKGILMETSVTTKPIIIGRGEGSTLLINDSSISINHAKITMRQGKVYIKDLDSANGVFVNGNKIPVIRAKKIIPGDQIKIGLNIFSLEEYSENAESEKTMIIERATGSKFKLVLKGEQETPMETSVTAKPIVIGRGAGSTLILNDSSVSLNHAKVTMRKGKVYIKDLGSTNGIFINGKKCPVNQAINIVSGDDIKIGLNILYLEEYSEEGIDKTIVTQPKASLADKAIKLPAGGFNDNYGKEQQTNQFEKPIITNGNSTLDMNMGKSVLQKHKLVIISGEDTGKEFYIEGTLLIGRSEDNDIVLNDPLVSRGHHAKVVHHKDNWITITDLNSANGTMIGNTKIKEAILTRGMEIQIGGTVLRFITLGEAVSLKAKASGENGAMEFIKSIPKPILVSISFFVIALAILFIMSSNENGSESNNRNIVPAQKVKDDHSINLYLNNVRTLVNAELWNDAVAELRKVLAMYPDNFEAGTLKDQAETELGYQEVMKMAASNAAEGNLQEAITALVKIPPTSFYYDKAGDTILKYQELLNNINKN